MTAPNINSLVSIIGFTTYVGVNSTSPVGILTNSAGSNSIYKVNTIRLANRNNGASRDCSITYGSVSTASSTYLVQNVTIPSNSSLYVSDKNTFIYMEENTRLVAIAQTANEIDVTVTYERIL